MSEDPANDTTAAGPASAESACPAPEQWPELFGDRLFRYAFRLLRDRTVAEDLVQETFLAALDRRAEFQNRSAFLTWLTSILRNKVIDYLRTAIRRGRHHSIEESADVEPPVGFGSLGIWNVYVPNWAKSADSLLEDRQLLDVVHRCLDKLPGRQGEILRLKLLEDLDNAEICKLLELSQTNLWVLLHRARMAVRSCVEKNWYRKR